MSEKNESKRIGANSIQAGRDKSPAIIVILGEGNTKVRLAIIEMNMLEQLTEEEYNV